MTRLEAIPASVLSAVALGPIAYAWVKWFRGNAALSPYLRFALPASLVTLSAIFFAAANFAPALLSGNYSTQRYVTIYANIAACALALLLLSRARHSSQGPFIVAAGIVGAVWTIAAVGSSVV